ncbi:hypothetical protein Aca07nite_72080 [Actinoplanes capillaceus]|uniref:Uncharacterized protein n=1 Tax=Actinoplanes campanulatus TaxID=113559 RepID=A0ABQ3WUG1_9ACTN|nr:hypothetical protein [Actinoplanes capillaceus]GID49933.1 hypothetical protein Aca07nite_72080 [Actinoplanes capillaceus]
MNLATLIACVICHQAVTENRRDGKVTYRHPVGDDHTHDVVPVPVTDPRHVFNRCHTCTGAPPMWDYRTGLIGIVAIDSGTVETYNDQWHVCARCAAFIEADDIDGLTAHSAALMRWRPGTDKYTILHTLHRGIVLGRESRALLTTTPWPTAKIATDMLPKIRDRLTGLLRSPINLPTPINKPPLRRDWADHIDRAPLYWIDREHTDLTNAVGSDQPPARVTDDLPPSPTGLLAWPEPVGTARTLAAVSWTPDDTGWHITGYRSIGNAADHDLMPALRHEIGWLIPIHAEHIPRNSLIDGTHPLGPLVTTWLLIHQQLADAVPAQLPKQIIKAYARHQRPAPDVRVVRIRQSSTSRPPKHVKPGPASKRAQPDHRYWVSGHDRQQPYGPGRTQTRTVTIQPFLKGDPSLPIKLSTTVRVLSNRTTGKNSSRNSE